jgi:hypothetical protein
MRRKRDHLANISQLHGHCAIHVSLAQAIRENCFEKDVLGVFRPAYEPGEDRVETVLIAADQKAECLTLAGAARLHQAVVVLTPGHRSIGRSRLPRSFCKKTVL